MTYFRTKMIVVGLAIGALIATCLTPRHESWPEPPPVQDKCESHCLDIGPELLAKSVELLKAEFPKDSFEYVLGGYILVNKNETGNNGNLLVVIVVHSGIDNSHNTQAVRYFIVVQNFQVSGIAKEDLLHTWDVNLKRWL